MTFQPVLPIGGYAGWRILQETLPTQKAAFEASPVRSRDTEYFRETIGTVQSPEDLVADRRLLTVALGAFGLDEDINNKAFIEKVLSDGYSDSEALANKLADKRYLQFSEAFGFGEGLPPRTNLSTFADEILTAYETRQFEIAIGEADADMRLALGAERELGDIATDTVSDLAKWFSVLGSPPLRAVFEGALNLPSSVATVDIDKQVEIFQDAADRIFGTNDISDFEDPELQEQLVRRFLVTSQIAAGPSALTPGAAALTLLGGAL